MPESLSAVAMLTPWPTRFWAAFSVIAALAYVPLVKKTKSLPLPIVATASA